MSADARGVLMTTEDQLAGWTKPSSDTEQEKQERTERMVREAVANHHGFDDCRLSVYAKGSYPNNTNVKSDSDVDIGVQCHNVEYWGEQQPGDHPAGSPYEGPWTPEKLRAELVSALKVKFPDQVDTSGSTAIVVHSSTVRVDADVVPCFDYKYYFSSGSSREGAKTFRKTTGSLVNYPAQHLENGRAKNTATKTSFKQAVRILKRVENLMFEAGVHRVVPSYFVECLVYNCPNSILLLPTWINTIKGVLVQIWDGLQGDEPSDEPDRWLEVNRGKFLFSSAQKWNRADGRDFAKAAWNYLGFG
jgi:hypothetical protein